MHKGRYDRNIQDSHGIIWYSCFSKTRKSW